MRLIRWILWILVSVQFGACAQGIPDSQIGLVLLHGKWATPPGPGAQFFSDKGFRVDSPWMPWNKQGYYGKPYAQALAEVHDIVQTMRRSGMRRVILGGQSLGANAALAYATLYDDVDGLMLFAPGHLAERAFASGLTRQAVLDARDRAQAGNGSAQFGFTDFNQGRKQGMSASVENFLSYFDPEGLANMPDSAEHLKRPIPVLCVMSQAELPLGRDYIFSRLPANPLSVYIETHASHADAPAAVAAEALAFVRSVAAQ